MMADNWNHNIMTDLQGYLTMGQIEAIINAASNQRDAILLRLLSRTGRRISEIVGRKEYVHRNATKGIEVTYPKVEGIRPRDINWENNMIAFYILKKKHLIRKVKPVDRITMRMLREYIDINKLEPDMQIFDISRFRCFQIVRQCAERAGIFMVGDKAPHPHHFRHSFAVQALKHSKDATTIKRIQMALEHSDLSITSGYLQLSQEDIRQMVEDTFGDEE